MITEDLGSALGARGCSQYGAPGGVASSPAAVRLVEVLGGGLLKRTCGAFFTGRCGTLTYLEVVVLVFSGEMAVE